MNSGKLREDIISRLPDDILIDILSRLETIDAVRTCVLSSRWKNIWKSIYNLSFKFGQIQPIEKPTSIVNQVLTRLQSGSIRVFGISYEYYCIIPLDSELRYIEKSISYAIEHNVRELTLHIHDHCDIKLPQSILKCKSLEKLKLRAGPFFFDIPEDFTVWFPSLKLLHIWSVIYSGNDQILRLFRSCPVLEDLKMVARFDCDKTLEINIPTLRRLFIKVNKNELGVFPVILGETPFLNEVVVYEFVSAPVSENAISYQTM